MKTNDGMIFKYGLMMEMLSVREMNPISVDFVDNIDLDDIVTVEDNPKWVGDNQILRQFKVSRQTIYDLYDVGLIIAPEEMQN